MNENISEISIIYDINKKDESIEREENKINILGSEFIKNNKNICKLIIDNKEYEINDKYNTKKCNDNILKIKLKGINNITDMSNMFKKCSSLISLPDISKWNTSNVTNMSDIFYGCLSLKSLPDISRWNTSNVTNMSGMFYECLSLKSLPDISRWNTSNVTNIYFMFYNCTSLTSLPDISRWNTNKVTNISRIFAE